MIQLYDFELSSSCYKVRLFLNILKLEYEVIPVGFYPKEEHKKPNFLAINPLGQLPVLQDDDLVLRDSQAILVYLAKRYDLEGIWYPDSAKMMGQISMWLSFAGGELMSASAARLHDVLRHEYDIKAARNKAHNALRVLDDHLASQRIRDKQWIVGDHPTIADISCFPCVALSNDGGIERDEYPSVEYWLNNVKKLPGFLSMPGVLEPYTSEEL